MTTYLALVGSVFLLLGAIAGWLLPRLAHNYSILVWFSLPASPVSTDQSAYLGANITAISVLIAVVVSRLQDPFQTSEGFSVRSSVQALLAFGLLFVTSALSLAVSLIYLLVRPPYAWQLWQLFIWFCATLLFTLNYLWSSGLRSSLGYGVLETLNDLAHQPVESWESLRSYSTLQTLIVGANQQGDLATARYVSTRLGQFLVEVRDPRAEAAYTFHRSHYRALKNLLSACSQFADEAPNAAVYYLGFIAAGAMLQAAALGVPLDDPEYDLFSGVFRVLARTPERLDPFMSGVRHALLHTAYTGSEPYLARFWRTRRRHETYLLRSVPAIASGLTRLLVTCRLTLQATTTEAEADSEVADMLISLYRDVIRVAASVVALRSKRGPSTAHDLAAALLAALNSEVDKVWPAAITTSLPEKVLQAYESASAEVHARAT